MKTINFVISTILICILCTSHTNAKMRLVPLQTQEALQHMHQMIDSSNAMRDSMYQLYSQHYHQISNFDLISFAELVLGELSSQSIVNRNLNRQMPIDISLPNVTNACGLQLLQFANALTQREMWAIGVLDAFGKPPSGILEGSLFWAGEIVECINTTQPNWNGKYCAVGKPMNQTLMAVNPALKYGACMPDKCNDEDIATIINFAIEMLPSNITSLLPFKIDPIDESYVVCQPLETKLDSSANLALAIIGILVAIVGLGTIYDIYKRAMKSFKEMVLSETDVIDSQSQVKIGSNEKEVLINQYLEEREPAFLKVLLSFSIYTNAIKLFQVNRTADQLDCLHAIRFLSIAWVILGHTFAFSISYLDNPSILAVWLKRFSFMFISNAFFSVDNFFLMSGLLTCYLFLKETDKQRGIKPGLMFKYYFHRIWRLTPPYMLVLMFSATLTPYLGTGPAYPLGGFEINRCTNSWWTNLFYVNNLVKTDQSCLAVSWYLANDMQFHVISPIMLIPFAIGKKFIGIIITTIILIANIIITSLIINHYPGSEMGMLDQTFVYFNKVYITPWCRIGPFAIGILVGYAIYSYKKKPTFKIPSTINILLWLFSLFTLGLLLFGLYPDFNGNMLSRVSHILYQASSRTIWAIALGYIIYACVTSNGGIINTILSWKIWTPLSRLSYSAYLIHATILFFYIYTQQKPMHYQDTTLIYMYISTMGLSFSAAFLVSMFFEVPLLGLEKFILRK